MYINRVVIVCFRTEVSIDRWSSSFGGRPVTGGVYLMDFGMRIGDHGGTTGLVVCSFGSCVQNDLR